MTRDDARGLTDFRLLRRRLVWKLLIAYVTPLIILSAYFHHQYAGALRERVDNHLKAVVENQRNTVDLFLEERVANMRNVFSSKTLQVLPPPEGLDGILGTLKQESPYFSDVGLFSESGKLISYSGPFASLLGKDYSGEDWFREILDREEEVLVSDVFLGFRGRPHFIIAVRRELEGARWFLRASVDSDKFAEFVRSTHLAPQAEAFLVNREGLRQTGGGDPAASATPAPPARSAEAVVVDIDRDLYASVWLTQNDWALVVRVPTRYALAPLRRARVTLTAIMLLALLLIVVLVFRNTASVVSRLERAVAAKSLLQKQLADAAKLASVGEMAAGVAHEINNPLAVIHEEAEVLLDLLDPEFGQEVHAGELAERLRAISDATIRGRDITAKLLTFARRHDSTPEPTDLNALAERVVAMKELSLKVSNIRVERDYETDLPDLLVAANQLEQVLLNLLNNARDAIDGSGTIRLRTRRTGDEVRLSVADDGSGMPPERLERIFFPFFTTKGVGWGTGLGLSISFGIVESLGGRFEVESEVGRGSTFTVVLPLPGRGGGSQERGRREPGGQRPGAERQTRDRGPRPLRSRRLPGGGGSHEP